MINMAVGLLISGSIITNVSANPMQQKQPVASVVLLAQAPPEDPPLPPKKASDWQGYKKGGASTVEMPPEDPPPKPGGKVKPGTAATTGELKSQPKPVKDMKPTPKWQSPGMVIEDPPGPPGPIGPAPLTSDEYKSFKGGPANGPGK